MAPFADCSSTEPRGSHGESGGQRRGATDTFLLAKVPVKHQASAFCNPSAGSVGPPCRPPRSLAEGNGVWSVPSGVVSLMMKNSGNSLINKSSQQPQQSLELCNTLKQLCNKEENKNVLKRSISSTGGWGINQRKPCTESNVSARFGRTWGFVFLLFLFTNCSSANCGPQLQMVYNCIMLLKFMNQCHQWSSVTSTS